MKGNVLGFDADANTGAISGYDGRRYEFAAADWQGQTAPRHGTVVDFTVEGERATRIYPLEPHYVRPGFGAFYFSPVGRISRAQFWLRAIVPIWLLFALGWVLVWTAAASGSHALAILLSCLLALYGLVMIWPLLVTHVKRIHDRNKSGWFILIPLIPAVLTVVLWAVALSAAAAAFVTGGAPLGAGVLVGAGAFSIVLYAVQFVIGLWFFIEFGCLRGTVGANRFGPDPLP